MKYQNFNNRKRVKQSFRTTKVQWTLNPVTNELEKLPFEKDLQKDIDAGMESALQNVLNRFLPDNVEDRDEVVSYVNTYNDLASIGEAMEVLEDYRERLRMPLNASYDDIQKAINKLQKAQLDKIRKSQQPKEVVKDNDLKGGVEGEETKKA